MIVGVLLVLVGLVLIISNPILGFIPGVLLIVIGIIVAVLAFLGRSVSAVLGFGRRRRD
ncbi:MAG TPA: hypothetical protein VM253_07760 [Candidatus Limnocylindrales bacterium]|nr:hypothetical protein [Candidatus Limnocylindrales bacterium]